jgi:hypothetical protein
MKAMRKDLGSLETRTLSWCRACALILDVTLEIQARVRDYQDHHLDAHQGQPYDARYFILLENLVFGHEAARFKNRRPLK